MGQEVDFTPQGVGSEFAPPVWPVEVRRWRNYSADDIPAYRLVMFNGTMHSGANVPAVGVTVAPIAAGAWGVIAYAGRFPVEKGDDLPESAQMAGVDGRAVAMPQPNAQRYIGVSIERADDDPPLPPNTRLIALRLM